MYESHNEIRIGYACINTELRNMNIYTSRSLILKTAKNKGFEYINQLITDNIDDLMKILIYNEAHGIRFFRISSCIFPHLDNPQLENSSYNIDFVKDKLKSIGKFAKIYGHRLTMHPGQYVQLGSPNKSVVERSIIDIKNHVQLLKFMGYHPSDGSVIIIHGGGTFENKSDTLNRWKQNFLSLPHDIRNYICLENDENGYNISDLLPICEELHIPFCLDIFHNRVSKQRQPITKSLLTRIFATWKNHGNIPKIHYSEQQIGLKRGAHSKTIDKLPNFVLKIPKMFNTRLDIMLEVKDKEKSVFKMYHKYFNANIDVNGRIDYTLKKN